MAKKRLTMRFRIPQWKRKREEGERLEQQRGLEYEREADQSVARFDEGGLAS